MDDIKALPEEYYWKSKKPGALFATVQLLPSPPVSRQPTSTELQTGTIRLLTAKDIPPKRQCIEIADLTIKLQSFANAQLTRKCIQSPNQIFLPYPQDKFKKVYVRKCYEDVFCLLLERITLGMESFAISGTPGIGKSLLFVYILHRLMKDFSEKTLSLIPNRIIYQSTTEYTCFNLENQTAVELEHLEAKARVRLQDTLYIIDGQMWQS